jgi:hypothetical protein
MTGNDSSILNMPYINPMHMDVSRIHKTLNIDGNLNSVM